MEDKNLPDDTIFEDTLSMEGYDKPVKRARAMLFVLAAIELLSLVYMKQLEETAKILTISIAVFIAASFVALAFWTKRKPYTAILTALILYTSLVIMDAIVNPATLFTGWLIKVLVYVLLIPSLSNAKEVQQWLDVKKK